MASQWNAYERKTATYGGSLPIWAELPDFVESGGLIANTNLTKGEIISGGSAVYFNTDTKEAKILKIFKVTATSTQSTNTLITVSQVGNLHKLNQGDAIMVLPSTIGGTGKSVATGSLDTSVDGQVTFTAVTANIDSVSVGTYLALSDGVSATAHLYCQPNSLTIDDTVVGDQNSVGIARGAKYVYSNTIPWLPAVIAANIPMLEFHQFNQ